MISLYAQCIPNHCEYFRKRGQSHRMGGRGVCKGGARGWCKGGGGSKEGGRVWVESPKFMRGNDRVVLSKTHSTPFFLEAFVLCAYRPPPESGVVTSSENLKTTFLFFAKISVSNSRMMNTNLKVFS
jgi:hypothetical protein